MNLYISTNCFITSRFKDVFKVLEELSNRIEDKSLLNKIGVEVFPNYDNKDFVTDINEGFDKLMSYSITLHGPYFNIEHSSKIGTYEYNRAKEEFIKVLELGKELSSKHIVFHHNNKIVDEKLKGDMIRNSEENLKELNEIANDYGIKILVENAGVNSIGNNIFSEEEFIEMANRVDNDILIDIGHSNANGWDLNNVIKTLRHKIKAYHIHNNDGKNDNHNGIFDGTLNFENFISLYKEYTPTADIVLEYGYQYNDKITEVVEDTLKVLDYFK